MKIMDLFIYLVFIYMLYFIYLIYLFVIILYMIYLGIRFKVDFFMIDVILNRDKFDSVLRKLKFLSYFDSECVKDLDIYLRCY